MTRKWGDMSPELDAMFRRTEDAHFAKKPLRRPLSAFEPDGQLTTGVSLIVIVVLCLSIWGAIWGLISVIVR